MEVRSDQKVQRKMFFLAEAGCWDWRTRVVVAKKTYSVRLPLHNPSREGL